jgi:ribonuclease E
MANKMLIDAAHPEETRVVVVRGNRIEEFDFEAANRKQLRGNIYLAKVTRVEPSLQAAFIEYGGNRHGFLAFSEIHPDYYQIPVADREALLAEDARADREADEEEGRNKRRRSRTKPRSSKSDPVVSEAVSSADDTGSDGHEAAHDAQAAHDDIHGASDDDHHEDGGHHEAHASDNHDYSDHHDDRHDYHDHESDEADGHDGAESSDDSVEQVGAEDAMEEVPERPRHYRRQYKIQEVIKRRQILLVQVVKEERGNKGAALTTYLSLAGRYSVLMPNTGRGGGISRKITNVVDRKRLKTIAQDLEVPDGMGVILRTAGAARTKPEIKRDFEYLMRLWENVRELTMQSTAPALVYEEGSLVKRSIRDLYNKDIDEVIVAGEASYKDAKDFMRMLMPSHARNVKPYRDPQPLFARYGIEAQLDAMFSNQVTLKSGGYLVINQTEALVAIDVNSGRATREHNIEDTALKTNLEAADEVARQLRLRDLAGLVVIDFIDMEENRNNRAVERRMKDALKNDRARIQVGRISPFGLLEMSRQRIRTGVLEGSTIICPHCAGIGFVRAVPSVALHVLRAVEEHLLRSATHNLTVRTRSEVALYILNQKRSHLRALEERFGVVITVLADDSHSGTHAFAIERGELATPVERIMIGVQVDSVLMDEDDEDDIIEEIEDEEEDETLIDAEAASHEDPSRESPSRSERGERQSRADDGEGGTDEQGRRRRRRRRRRGRGDREGLPQGERPMSLDAPQPDITIAPFNGETIEDAGSDRPLSPDRPVHDTGDGEGLRGRRRGRRGGRRNRRDRDETGNLPEGQHEDGAISAETDAPSEHHEDHPAVIETEIVAETVAAKAPRGRRKAVKAEEIVAGEVVADEVVAETVDAVAPAAEPAKRRGRPSKKAIEAAEAAEAAALVASAAIAEPSTITEPAQIAEPASVAPAPVAAPVVAEPVVAPPAPVIEQPLATEPVIVGAENKERRGGWWAKAKSAITGN